VDKPGYKIDLKNEDVQNGINENQPALLAA
jgi:hypothetical protein